MHKAIFLRPAVTGKFISAWHETICTGTSTVQDAEERRITRRREAHFCKFRTKYYQQRRAIWSLHGKVNRLKSKIQGLKEALQKQEDAKAQSQLTQLNISEEDVPKPVFSFMKSQKRFHQCKLGGMRLEEDDMKLATTIHFRFYKARVLP